GNHCFIRGRRDAHGPIPFAEPRSIPDDGCPNPRLRVLVHDPGAARAASAPGQPPGGGSRCGQAIGTTPCRAREPVKMPFGKYKDLELAEVRRPYLGWLRGQPWVGTWLARAIDEILAGDEQRPEVTLEEALRKWREGRKGE